MSWNTADNVDPKLQDWGEAYKALCALLKERVPELKHVDLYYGQDQLVDSDGNWLPFRAPAVFLEFQAPQVNDLGDLCQQLDMDITVWVATETVQDTHHGSAGQRKAMEFVGLMRKIHVALHNASGQHFSPLSRVGMQRKADAPPYMYMYGQTYRGVLLDNSTSPQLAYLYPPHQLEIEPVSGEVPGIPDPQPGECPTVQQLIPITTVQVIAESLTTQQAADLYVILGGTGGDLATLVGQATPQQLYAVMTPEQMSYVQGLLPGVAIRNTLNTTLATVNGGDPPYTVGDAILRTGDLSTIIQTIPAEGMEAARPTRVKFIAADGSTQYTGGSATEYTGLAIQMMNQATPVPRITIYEPDGVTPHTYRDIVDPTFTLPASPPAGAPIIYQFGRFLSSGQTTSQRTGDDGWLLSQGWYDYAPVAGAGSVAQRAVDDSLETLLHPNIFGNTSRFTSTTGGVAPTTGNRVIRDHLHGLDWGIIAADVGSIVPSWDDAIDWATGQTLGGNTDWQPVSLGILSLLARRALFNVFGYAPFSWSPSSAHFTWTSTAQGNQALSSKVAISALGAMNTTDRNTSGRRLFLFVRRFI